MKSKIHILIIDDDPYFRIALKNLLCDEAIFTEAESEARALELLESNFFDMALIDMDIDGAQSGIKILNHTKLKKIQSIIISSYGDDETIEKAYISGCDHFLSKVHYKEHLPPYIHKYKNNLYGTGPQDFFKKSYLTQDQDLKEKITEISQLNLKNKTVLITGETGVGKSLIGELLHKQSYDESKPFIHINCSEIAESLLESELFGHKKGSFTGATQDKIGKLEAADGGTLFLDEVGTMPLSMQKKLLKAIDQKSFYAIGSNKETHSSFTLISATCEDLFEKIHKEEFRKDFFFRISGLNLNIPPLRERKQDIELLIKHFLRNSPRKVILKTEALDKLASFSWEGNTRQLKKEIECLTSKNKGIIEISDIKLVDRKPQSSYSEYLTSAQLDFIANYGLRNFIKNIEEQSLNATLKKHQGKITHAIKELRISSSAFYRIFRNLKKNL